MRLALREGACHINRYARLLDEMAMPRQELLGLSVAHTEGLPLRTRTIQREVLGNAKRSLGASKDMHYVLALWKKGPFRSWESCSDMRLALVAERCLALSGAWRKWQGSLA